MLCIEGMIENTVNISPPIRHTLSLENENRWSNLLALLIERDPSSGDEIFRLGHDLNHLTVRREESKSRAKDADPTTRKSDRTDIVIKIGNEDWSAIEVKVLSGLAPSQLARNEASYPNVKGFNVIYPSRLPIGLPPKSRWKSNT